MRDLLAVLVVVRVAADVRELECDDVDDFVLECDDVVDLVPVRDAVVDFVAEGVVVFVLVPVCVGVCVLDVDREVDGEAAKEPVCVFDGVACEVGELLGVGEVDGVAAHTVNTPFTQPIGSVDVYTAGPYVVSHVGPRYALTTTPSGVHVTISEKAP